MSRIRLESSRALRELSAIALLAVALLQVASLGVRYGLPHRLFRDRMILEPTTRVEAQLLDAPPGETYDAIVLGDPTFVEDAHARLPAETNVLVLETVQMDLGVFTALRSTLERLGVRRIYVQNSPLFWSDASFFAAPPQLALYQRTVNHGFSVVPLQDARLFIRYLRLWADTPEKKAPAERLTSWMGVRPDVSGVRKWLFSSPQAERMAPSLVWVSDGAPHPADADPELIDAFAAKFRNGAFDPAIGRAVDLETLHEWGP